MNTCKKTVLLLLLILCSLQLKAQNKEYPKPSLTPWYVGVKGGIPFGVSTFTSLGTDKNSLGYNVGALVGYQYNSIFSFEFSAMFGRMRLNATNGDANYWLGTDDVRYPSQIVGEQGHYYRDLYSSVQLQQYGLHLNINLLPVFDCSTYSRFSVLISPAIYGIGTRATLKTISNEKWFIKNKSQFNFGVGGDVSVDYRLTDNLAVRLSSGVNYAVGRHFDGVPAINNNTNLIWNNNISVTWRFGNNRKISSEITSLRGTTSFQSKTHATTTTVAVDNIAEDVFTEKIDIVAYVKNEKQISFPSIYFAFNSVDVTSAQMGAVEEVVQIMNDNPDVAIIIRGFTDRYGSDEVNKMYARRRTETVQSLLISRGVNTSRIKTIGLGVDTNAKTETEARRVDITADIKTQIAAKSNIQDVATEVKTPIERKPIVQNIAMAEVKTTRIDKANIVDLTTGNKFSIEQNSISFPSIYFSFSSIGVASEQMDAVDQIVQLMNDNHGVMVDITGFATKDGFIDINNRLSQKTRTLNLKSLLIKKGIDASRIITVSVEVDTNAKTETEARRIDVTTAGVTKMVKDIPLSSPATYFDINGVRVSSTKSNSVDEIVAQLRFYPDMSVTITGFPGDPTPVEVNQRRLEEFKDLLVEQGINTSSIKILNTNTSTSLKQEFEKTKSFFPNSFESNDTWVFPRQMNTQN